MQALFVHGMGRSPLSGWPLLLRLKMAGVSVGTFGYFVSIEDFNSIVKRLVIAITQIAFKGDYVVIGHSLGGVLLRAAVSALPAEVPRPGRAFMLGSPVRSSSLALSLSGNPIFRLLTRDCGQMLGSGSRMSSVAPMQAPTTTVIGIQGLSLTRRHFGAEPNDGVVSVSEVCAEWQDEQIQIEQMHTILPLSRRVAKIILQRLKQADS